MISLVIEKYAPPGNGLGFYQDKAVFVPQTAVGDEVLLTIEKEKKRYIIGRLEEVVKPGSKRRKVPCPYYVVCGGCDLLHLSYSDQLALKKEMLVQVLAGAGILEAVNMVAAPSEFYYRHRALFRSDHETGDFGFLRRRSHQVAVVPDCLVLAQGLKNLLKELAVSPDLPKKTTACYGLASSGEDFAAAVKIGRNFQVLPGIPETVMENYGFGDLELAASGFAQVNPAITRLMISDLLQYCVDVREVSELYGGSGTFSLPLATIARNLTVYESDHAAAARGRRNAARNGLENVRIVSGRVEKKALPKALDTLVVDPPRSGLQPVIIEKMVKSRASQLVYISCNPATLARDLARLKAFDNGFTLDSLNAYDMYAGTTHLEVMAVLKR
ncbi:MAG: class I SAM-dependent RNA methyltransferase [Deltaproteobacteria bacterium]|nr:class I SAM-dependent RNA methyltransferase [Deltaproteobacteria bacterium]